jgi:hypothetical protein
MSKTIAPMAIAIARAVNAIAARRRAREPFRRYSPSSAARSRIPIARMPSPTGCAQAVRHTTNDDDSAKSGSRFAD